MKVKLLSYSFSKKNNHSGFYVNIIFISIYILGLLNKNDKKTKMVYNITSPLYYYSNYTVTEEIILSVVLILTIVFSFYGNVCMLIVLYKNDRMWNSTYMLIGNLIFSGLLVTIFCMPFSLISVLYGRWPFGEGKICKFNAFMESQLLLATILTHTVISVDKYFAVVKPFSRIMSVRNTRILIFIIWFIAVMMSIGPVFGFGHFSYNPTTLICGVGFPQNKLDSLYLLLLGFIAFILPNVIMFYVYLHVFLAVRTHTKRLIQTCACSLEAVKLQKHLILTVFFSCICFLACWTPFFLFALLAIVAKSPADLPHALGVTAYWCGYLYNAINPLILCSMSKRFGDGIVGLTSTLLHSPCILTTSLTNTCSDICGRRTIEFAASSKQSSAEPLTTVMYMKYSKVENGVSTPVLQHIAENGDNFIVRNEIKPCER